VTTADYTTVTETWGLPASPEQLAAQYHRYRMGAELAPGGAVLEVGCGSGMGLPYLRARGRMAVGGDYTMDLLREARQNLPDAMLVRMDAQHLPFREGAFDAVLLLEMIYYVADQAGAIAECRRVLKPGGKLMMSVPNPDRPDFNRSPFSTRYPNLADLHRLLSDAGFKVHTYGDFPIEPATARDRVLDPVRSVAVRLHLVPRSMRMKALVKRVFYGRLPRLGAVHDGMATYAAPAELDPAAKNRPEFKTLYAVGVASSR
jgi:SAM-dependent methyltransferase